MKTLLSVFSLISLLGIAAHAEGNPTLEPVTFQKIYAPEGFDDNDNVQIVGEGMFSNACYRQAHTKAKIDHEKKTIELAPVAYRYNALCLQVILPFERVVDLGVLKAGTYSITQAEGVRMLGTITIKKSKTKQPDDYLYAPISQAFFQSRFMANKVYLIGDFPLSCMKMKEIKTDVQANVLVIQPIVEIDRNVPCVSSQTTFEQVVEVGNMPAGRYLLHVRTMNGKSVNNLVDVKEL